ncbi:DUF1874 domain-containing protein [Methanosphaera sp. BMS]|uniref:DUF1874 domain-containing protein n=1 Tax=Methanosphaera sp. BMS TaxID=1789762 RepID=UPI000DC1E9BB|nr:DUF1874 domain-containing protein [Methanosphaera sp. BMS]AWX31771.1 hypothetical protein AW729_01115 [Methanosphaera sp. BMS]
MKYISNGFSPKMLNPKKELNFVIELSSYDEIQENRNDLISSIGHQNIADHLQIEKNRINILLDEGDTLYLVSPQKDDYEKFNYRKITIQRI